MPLPESYGVFISPKAVRQQPPEDLQRLCYRTTQGVSFRGRPLDPEARPENMEDLFMTGHRQTKYMGFPLKEAPSWNRDDCWYTNDFAKKPLVDHAANKQLAEIFRRPPFRARSAATLPFGSSAYSEHFPQYSPEQMHGARADEQTPIFGSSICISPPGPLLYTRSISHETLKAKPLMKTLGAADLRPTTNLTLTRTSSGDMLRSLYRTDFGPKASRCAKRQRSPGGEPATS